MYFDIYYLILVMPAVLFAMWASGRVKSTFAKYEHQLSKRGIRAADACRNVLNANGLSHVKIVKVEGHLTDHYNPKTETIGLSTSVYDSTSVAAIGVACHEAGHAIQYSHSYFPIHIRNAILPIAQISSNLAMPLVMIGFLLSVFSNSNNMLWLAYVGLFGFFMAALFQLLTLPVEFDASKRAIQAIDNAGYLTEDEIVGSKNVLNAAALTYVAALAVSIMTFLRFALLIFGRSRD